MLKCRELDTNSKDFISMHVGTRRQIDDTRQKVSTRQRNQEQRSLSKPPTYCSISNQFDSVVCWRASARSLTGDWVVRKD